MAREKSRGKQKCTNKHATKMQGGKGGVTKMLGKKRQGKQNNYEKKQQKTQMQETKQDKQKIIAKKQGKQKWQGTKSKGNTNATEKNIHQLSPISTTIYYQRKYELLHLILLSLEKMARKNSLQGLEITTVLVYSVL